MRLASVEAEDDPTKPRRPIRRNNTIGASPHEAAKYRVSFEDDLKKPLVISQSSIAKDETGLTLSSPSSPNLIPTPPAPYWIG